MPKSSGEHPLIGFGCLLRRILTPEQEFSGSFSHALRRPSAPGLERAGRGRPGRLVSSGMVS